MPREEVNKEISSTSKDPLEEALESEEDFDEDSDSDLDSDNIVNDGTTLRPTVVTYNACLNAWARSDTQEAAPRADALLQRMIESSFSDKDAVKPNGASFNTVINAWARYSRYDSEAPQKAEDLLNRMYDLYYSERLDDTCKPNAVTYTSVINAWARSGERPDKTENARRLLDAMLSKYDSGEADMKPGIMAYTAVLNAAAHSPPSSVGNNDGGEDEFNSVAECIEGPYSIALQTFLEMQNDIHSLGISPDHLAFAAILQVIAKHTDPASGERRQMVETIFAEACKAGKVSSFVIRALREACPAIDLLERLLRSPQLARHLRSVDQLPKEWSRNVPEFRRYRKVDDEDRKGQQNGQTNQSWRGKGRKQRS